MIAPVFALSDQYLNEMDEIDEEEEWVMVFVRKKDRQKQRHGKGNAALGMKANYQMYEGSDVVPRVL